jgi:mannose-6-phosphate isomerase-like protein (cupin superfamily)
MNARWVLLCSWSLSALVHAGDVTDVAPGTAAVTSRTYASAAQVAKRISQARAAAQSPAKVVNDPLLSSGSVKVGLDYHQKGWKDTHPSRVVAHPESAELLLVIEGSGTLTLGGKLVDPELDRSPNAPDQTTLRADSSVGSSLQTLHKGDFVLIPPNTPHAISGADAELAIAYVHIPATTDEPSTSEVVSHHWKTFVDNDLDGTLADYTEDSILITPTRVYRGLKDIRENFIDAFKRFPKSTSTLQLNKTRVERDVGYILWEATGPTSRLAMGTDTFVVRHGKIVSQTFGGVAGAQ